MLITEHREELEKKTQAQLENEISDSYEYGYGIELAKFILQEKKAESQYQRSLDLIRRQNRVLIFLTILTIIGMLVSVILGYRLEEMKTHSQKQMSSELIPQQKLKQQTKQ